MSGQLGFYLDAAACNGCSVCLVACKDKYDNPVGVNFRKVIHHTMGRWDEDPAQPGFLVPTISAYSLSISCNHCAAPVCMEACPVAAISKRSDGLVLIDKNICVGCRLCECCPYDAPQFNEELGVMTMCDGCVDQGLETPQACVAACPQRALEFGELDELQARHGNAVNSVLPLPDPSITQPSLLVNPHRNSPVQRSYAGSSGETGANDEAVDARAAAGLSHG
ncbi:MAG: 4Fe-4S dicluster domain-containing protein [Burkholderiaceae bacterium]